MSNEILPVLRAMRGTTVHYVGRVRSDVSSGPLQYDAGSRVFAEISLFSPSGNDVRSYSDPSVLIPAPVRFTASFSVVGYRRRRIHACGQCGEYVSDADALKPSRAWTRNDIRSLHAIWQRWHLNDVRAGSEWHTENIPAGMSYDEISRSEYRTDPSGYVYGSRWLTEAIPSDVVAEIERLRALSDDADAYGRLH